MGDGNALGRLESSARAVERGALLQLGSRGALRGAREAYNLNQHRPPLRISTPYLKLDLRRYA